MAGSGSASAQQVEEKGRLIAQAVYLMADLVPEAAAGSNFLERHAAPVPNRRASLRDASEELGVMFEPVIEPVVLGRKRQGSS